MTIHEFLEHIKQTRHASENTIAAYRNDLSQFGDHLTRTLPADSNWTHVQASVLDEYMGAIAGKYSTSTVARKIAALKTFFHWLSEIGVIMDDGSHHLKSPKVDKKIPRILSEDDVARLMGATATVPAPRSLRDRALLELIYSTGMRVSEAITLKLSDINFEQAYARCSGKGTRQRSAPLTQRAIAALNAYLDTARGNMMSVPASVSATNGGTVREDVYLFLNPQGRNLTRQAVWLMTRQYARNCGIEGEVTPHTLRHSRAAHMLQGGEDVKRVQEWFGHANLATTQMYQAKKEESAQNQLAAAPSVTN